MGRRNVLRDAARGRTAAVVAGSGAALFLARPACALQRITVIAWRARDGWRCWRSVGPCRYCDRGNSDPNSSRNDSRNSNRNKGRRNTLRVLGLLHASRMHRRSLWRMRPARRFHALSPERMFGAGAVRRIVRARCLRQWSAARDACGSFFPVCTRKWRLRGSGYANGLAGLRGLWRSRRCLRQCRRRCWSLSRGMLRDLIVRVGDRSPCCWRGARSRCRRRGDRSRGGRRGRWS